MNLSRPSSVIITMAGRSSRFNAAGFVLPKYKLRAKGQSIFDWALRSLQGLFDLPFIFVVRREDGSAEFIREHAQALGIGNIEILELDAMTRGQAHTAYLACYAIDRSSAIFIYNIDTAVEPDAFIYSEIHGDGWIPCFQAPGSHWSFAAFDESDRRVTKIAEKNRISEYATIGLYYFGSRDLYEEAYRATSFYSEREEFVAPLYGQLISMNCSIFASVVPGSKIYPLGTPDEVRQFDSHFDELNRP